MEQIESLLLDWRPEWKPAQRALVARLAEGAAGRALGFDLEKYLRERQDALTLLRSAEDAADHSTLFRLTETYRAGAEGQEKTSGLIRALYFLLEDLLLLQAQTPGLVRNIDLLPELGKMAATMTPGWIENAARGLGQIESGMRRNLLRSLALDAFTAELTQ